MINKNGLTWSAMALLCFSTLVGAQIAPSAPKLKDEMRLPWQRGEQTFIRAWQMNGTYACALEANCLDIPGGEGSANNTDPPIKRAGGTPLEWRPHQAWTDQITFEAVTGSKDGTVAYALAPVSRPAAGKALLSVGSTDGIRVWVNGKLALSRDARRSWAPDQDQVEVDMNAGRNAVLVKAHAGSAFSLRVLESGAVVARMLEIAPVLLEGAHGFSIKTDATESREGADPVKLEVIRPGGDVVFTATAARGAEVAVDASRWPDGPYEVRASTRTPQGLRYDTHLDWYKGDALVKARQLAMEAAKADAPFFDKSGPEGFTLKMLVEMVDDRLGVKLAEATGNPWQKIHSPLMEFDELMLERQGKVGRVRPHGFVRLAWLDEVDHTPQYTRAYLPANYDKSKKWPLVIQIHGYNPANPVYWRWWSADNRHPGIDTEFPGHRQVIYMEPHGRGNTQYIGMGDSDILRAIAEAKRLFNVDENRVYLTGDSMGGWGTWNVGTRHPDLFAAIAPVFGGVDYHSQLSEEQLAALAPIQRFEREKQSSWSMADSLVNTPIYVHHGDMDAAVNVEWSRWGVRLLQRWGYNVRYREYPGRVHEALQNQNGNMSIEWFLQHERNPNPLKVRIRSAELRNASAYWVSVRQTGNPLDFMVVDAEVVDRNVIRVDTKNVLELVLTPAGVVDAAKPVKVVWNGVAQELRLAKDGIRLSDASYRPAKLHKTPALPGSTYDFTVTPFALVIGTTSKDPEMVKLIRAKAQGFIDQWKEWQQFEPRVFVDTEMQAADISRYSLLLLGGADANAVTARLASKLPVRITANEIVVDGKRFAVKDAALQMLYPNPSNSDRYVWLMAGTSTDGMFHIESSPFRLYDFDYGILDGHIPQPGQLVTPLQMRLASGSFDHNWRFSPALLHAGDSVARAKARVLRRPKADVRVDPKIQQSLVGRYQIVNGGPVVEILREGDKLLSKVGDQVSVLVAEDDINYYLENESVRVTFVRDTSGRVTGLTGFNGNHFEGRKLD